MVPSDKMAGRTAIQIGCSYSVNGEVWSSGPFMDMEARREAIRDIASDGDLQGFYAGIGVGGLCRNSPGSGRPATRYWLPIVIFYERRNGGLL